MWLCQVGLALTQAAFALGAVYYKYSLNENEGSEEGFHPIVFAFTREVVAGTVMCFLAFCFTGAKPKRADLPSLVRLGILLYCNQLFYILGVSYSGVVMATCMQPGIPVFTVAIAVLMKQEVASFQKVAGILLACFGAICMVFGGAPEEGSDSADVFNMYMGNVLLVLNVFAMSFYYILTKPLLLVYPPIAVAAWAYAIAANCMGITAFLVTQNHPENWNMPDFILGPLLYWIFVCSVGGYYIIALSMKHLPSSQVAAYQCLQPFVGTALAYTLLDERPTWWDVGGIGVIAGLFIVNRDAVGSGTTSSKYPLPVVGVKGMQPVKQQHTQAKD